MTKQPTQPLVWSINPETGEYEPTSIHRPTPSPSRLRKVYAPIGLCVAVIVAVILLASMSASTAPVYHEQAQSKPAVTQSVSERESARSELQAEINHGLEKFAAAHPQYSEAQVRAGACLEARSIMAHQPHLSSTYGLAKEETSAWCR